MIRKITKEDRALFVQLMDEFYHSPAVLHPIPEQVYAEVFEEMTSSDRYVLGYILEVEGQAAGYALLSKGFSTEVGGQEIWVEEVYIREAFRSHGLGLSLFTYLEETFRGTVRRLRLEVEPDNTRAIELYRRLGFEVLGYTQMIKRLDE